MFNTEGYKAPSKVSPYISVGNQSAEIKDVTIKEALSGSLQVSFRMENDIVPKQGAEFTPVEGAQGQVGNVSASIYMKDKDAMHNWIKERIVPIADAMGEDVRMKLDAIEVNNEDHMEAFKEYVAKLPEVLTGHKVDWLIGGEEYPDPQAGRIKTRLVLPRYSFVGAKAGKFDKTNKYHYKPYAGEPIKAAGVGGGNNQDDLPF